MDEFFLYNLLYLREIETLYLNDGGPVINFEHLQEIQEVKN